MYKQNQASPGSTASKASGGEVASVITGKGLLAPGTYTARCTLLLVSDTHAVVTFTLPTADFHTEAVPAWPSWLREGQDVSIEIGLSPGVIALRQGKKYALADARTKERLTAFLSSPRELAQYAHENGLKWAKPKLKEVRSGQQVYPFVEAKPGSSQPRPDTGPNSSS